MVDLVNRAPWHISEFPFSSSLLEAQGDFPQCLLWGPGRIPGGEPHNLVGSFLWLNSPGVFNSEHRLH